MFYRTIIKYSNLATDFILILGNTMSLGARRGGYNASLKYNQPCIKVTAFPIMQQFPLYTTKLAGFLKINLIWVCTIAFFIKVKLQTIQNCLKP